MIPGILSTGFMGAAKWKTAFEQALDADKDSHPTYNIRVVLDALGITGTKVRVTFEASSTQRFTTDTVYVGHHPGAGDAWDFDGNQAELLFSSSSGFDISAGETIRSDERAISIDGSKTLIVAFYLSNVANNGCRAKTTVSGAESYQKTAVGDQTSEDAPADYSATLDVCGVIKVEVYG